MRLLKLQRRGLVLISAALAGAWRLWLMGRYYGWEESDYGNLAMARGVLESGFRHYDMNHLPMYYGLSALVMAVVPDAVIATRFTSWCSGVASVGIGVWLADRLFGRRAAALVALWLILQPELALYSASSLREPVYALFLLLSFASLVGERLSTGALMAGGAFLTRMDALLALASPIAIHAAGRRPRLLRMVRVAAPLAGVAAAWSLYCSQVHGTWQFWGHSVAVNVETGGAEAGVDRGQWLLDGLGIAWALLTRVLPQHVGWLPWLGLWAGILGAPWGRHDARRTLTLYTGALLGFWLSVATVGQHSPDHNLYWKWMYGIVPFIALLGLSGAARALDRLGRVIGRAGAGALLAVGVAQGVWAMGVETQRQLELSAANYKPQLELAIWLEESADPTRKMLVDNIPGCWLDRRPNAWQLWTWFDVPPSAGVSPEAFSEWARGEDLAYVLWFREEWTQAPVIAPWMARVERHEVGGLVFTPLRDDDTYGWVFYEVTDVEAP